MDQQVWIDSFKEMIVSEPKRKGKPRLVTTEEMKSIWKTGKNLA
jgi:hypothetical protein